MVGDHDEVEAGRPRGRDHLVGSGRPVGQRGVHMDDSGHALVPVTLLLPAHRQRTPARDVHRPGEQGEKDENEEDVTEPRGRHAIGGWRRWFIK